MQPPSFPCVVSQRQRATQHVFTFACAGLIAAAIGSGCGASEDHEMQADGGSADDSGLIVTAPDKPLAGCDRAHVAVAHRSDAIALAKQPTHAPFVCLTRTGKPAYDPVLAIGAEGKVLFSPIGAGFNVMGLLGSTDNGATYLPLGDLPQGGASIHPWLWRDEASGRTFFNAFKGTPPLLSDNGVAECNGTGGADLWLSDDDGISFRRTFVGCGSRDYGKIITGPAATAQGRAALAASKFPSMVYYCATGPTVLTGPNRMCYRSSDGGKTFERTKTDPVTEADGGSTWPEEGSVGDDGSIYIAHVTKAGQLGVAISRDDGDSWSNVLVAGSAYAGSTGKNWLSSNVRADAHGNVYAVWVDDNDLLPHLSYSRDRGKTWSKPILIAAPGVEHARYPNIGVRAPGYVAIAYYGSKNKAGNGADGYFQNDGRAYDAYLTVTTRLFDERPLLWSAQINADAEPVIPNGISFSVSEYIGAPHFAPDGSSWAAFVSPDSGIAARVTPPPL